MIISRLTPLQRDLLEAFFQRESRFFLTGGPALVGYHLGHRETADLDLFTTDDLLASGEAALKAMDHFLDPSAGGLEFGIGG